MILEAHWGEKNKPAACWRDGACPVLDQALNKIK